MQRAHGWAVIGLLSIVTVTGCAHGVSRRFLGRGSSNPAATSDDVQLGLPNDDALSVEVTASGDSDHAADEGAAMLHANGGEVDRNRFAPTPSDDAADTDVARTVESDVPTGGQFDVSSSAQFTASADAIVAPPPKRRATTTELIGTVEPPREFQTPPEARVPTSSGTDLQRPPTIAPSTSMAHVESPGGLITADYAQVDSAAAGNIELAAAQRAAANPNSRPSPWDRFRELTNTLPPRPNIDEPPADAHQIPQTLRPEAMHSGFPQAGPMTPAGTKTFPEPWPRMPGATVLPNVESQTSPSGQTPWGQTEPSATTAVVPSGFAFSAQPPSPQPPQIPTGTHQFGGLADAPATTAPWLASPELERLITQTMVEAAALSPGETEETRQMYLRKHVQLRLLHLIAGQMDRALQPVPGIDPADQEYWQHLLWAMANYFDTQGMPDSAERATQTVAQLKSAAARLQEKSRLELHNVAFCHRISGFGNYQRFKRDEFTGGQPVLLYAEVANFKSELTPDGLFRTVMKSTLEILEGGPTGRLVESLPLAPSEDQCRNHRRDYYHSYEFAIPQACRPGPHTLRLRVEDQLGKKTAVTTVNFTVQ